MYRPFVMSLALAALSSLCLTAAPVEGEKPSAKVLTITVHKIPPADIDPTIGDYGNGVNVLLMLTLPDKQVLTVDTNASTLDKATDDKGTDLTKPLKKGDYVPHWIDDYGTRVSKDKKHFSIRASFSSVPAEGAGKIILKGKIMAVCGSDEKVVEGKNVELKADKTTKVGPLIVAYDKNSFGTETRVAFTCEDAPRVKSVTFFDKDGQALRSNSTGHQKNSTVGRNDWTCFYSIESKVDSATIRIVYYEKIENVPVPVDITVGVGL